MAPIRNVTRHRRSAEEGTNKNPALAILAIDAKGRVTKANAPARKVLASATDSLEGMSFGDLVVRLLSHRAGDNESTFLCVSNAHGEKREVMVALSEAAALPGPSESASDPSEPRHAPAKSGLEPSRLSDYVAHEVRNPLGTILGFSQILRHRNESVSQWDREAALETIHSEAERAMLILEGLVRLAEARNKRQVETQNIPLHAVCRRVVDGHRRRNPHRQVVISGDSPLFACANSLWVELAMANLLGNAEKYTPRDMPIEIAFSQNGSEVAISVMDRGVSLPDQRYSSLWKLYDEEAPEVSISGSGIGLALCKDLVEGMGGRVWAGARAGGGSVFCLTLPAPWDSSVPRALDTRIGSSIEAPALDYMAWAA